MVIGKRKMERHSKNELEWETSGERGVVEVVSQTLWFSKGGRDS